MGKKKTLSTLSSLLLGNTELMKSSSSSSSSSSSLSSWPWPSCHQPRTLSFRANNNNKDSTTFKTINNSAYLDATMDNMLQTSESFFTVSPNTASFSTAASEEQESKKLDSIETVIRGSLRADRLFFEPDETKSILESNKVAAETEITSLPFNDTTVVFLSMESQDPYVDFRKSMEEMVAAHDVKEWECLQELLCWYLKVNDKTNHGYIVAAFVDLLVALAFASASAAPSFSNSSSSSYSFSPSSPLSFYSSSMSSSHCVSCLEPDHEDKLVDTDTPPKDQTQTSTSTEISSLCSSSSSSCT